MLPVKYKGLINKPCLLDGGLFLWLDRVDTKNIEKLQKDINAYIHFYNYERLQAKLNGLSPMEFRTQAA